MKVGKTTITTDNKEWLILEDTKLSQIVALQVTNRQALIDYIDGIAGVKGMPQDGILLHVELFGEQLGCDGGFADYKTISELPYQSVPCPCGNPKHWLIKYDEEFA